MSFTVATLTVELEDLRNNVCHSCKKRLAYSNASVPPITTSPGQGSTNTAASVSAPLWRRVSQGGPQRSRPRIDNAPSNRPSYLSPNINKLSEPDVAHHVSSSQATSTPIHPGPNEDLISPEQKPEPPKWSVEYKPDVKRGS